MRYPSFGYLRFRNEAPAQRNNSNLPDRLWESHRDALDAQIRVLQLHRAALAVVVKRAAGDEERAMMNKLAGMPAAERRQMIDDFLAEVFQGLDPSPARAQRWAAAPDLPDDPSPEQGCR